FQQPFTSLSACDERYFPCEIVTVLNTRVHALRACRCVNVRRVAGEKSATRRELVHLPGVDFVGRKPFSRFLWRPLWLALASRISSSRLIPNALQGEFYVELLRHNRSLFGCEESNYLRLRSYFQLYELTQDHCLLITEFLQTIGVRHSGE